MTATTPTPVVSASLRRNRGFQAFWSAQLLSVLGDSFSQLAVPLLVLDATGSIATAGLLTGVCGTAAVLAGLFAGVVVDRLDRRALLIGADLTRMLLLAAIPLLWWLAPAPPIWPLFVLLPLASAVGMLFQVAAVTAVRGLVADAELTRANGRLYAGTALAAVAGPALAGVLSGAVGPAGAVAADAVSFGLSAALLMLVRLPTRAAAPAVAGDRAGPWAEFLAGARFLLRHPVLRPLTALLTVFLLLTYGVDDVLIYHLTRDLGQADGTVGLVLAAGAAGTMTGALFAAPLRRRFGFGACWIGAVAVTGVAVAALALTRHPVAAGALLLVYFGGLSVGGICSMSLRQEVTPEHLLGRVTAAFWTIHFSLGGVGAAGLTWLAQRHGAPLAFAVTGGGCLAVAGAALRTAVRRPLSAPGHPIG